MTEYPMSLETDEEYELRVSRRQWMSPDKKEKVMGKLKEMVFNYNIMNPQQIFGALNQCSLLGFGYADYSDIENHFGEPAIGEVEMFDKPESQRFSVLRPHGITKQSVEISCAWGILWDDNQGVVIHDYNPATAYYVDNKHWHITGTREAWYRIYQFIVDRDYVRLESVEILG